MIFKALQPHVASLDAGSPEIPTFITFIYKNFQDQPWAEFLHQWDTLVISALLAAVISIIFSLGARRSQLIPDRIQNLLELIVETLEKFLIGILGPEGRSFVPFLGTLFIYILAMNWLVLIPFFKPPSSNFNVTIALAICVFLLVQYRNVRNFGVIGFLYHMAGSPKGITGWLMVPLMLPIELITQISRPVTLALRLFGNVVGEDILIGTFGIMGALILANFGISFGLPLQIPFLFLAILTGLMQALVFTLLSTTYILLTIPEQETKH